MILLYLIILFTMVPVIELYFLIKIGSYIGAFNTIGVVIATGVIGAFLAKREGLKVLQEIQRDLNQLRMPADTLLEGVFILVGGIMLLTPGFVTDTLGFLFVVPFTRKLFLVLIKKKLRKVMDKQETITIHHF